VRLWPRTGPSAQVRRESQEEKTKSFKGYAGVERSPERASARWPEPRFALIAEGDHGANGVILWKLHGLGGRSHVKTGHLVGGNAKGGSLKGIGRTMLRPNHKGHCGCLHRCGQIWCWKHPGSAQARSRPSPG